jgi:hypothetical protein
MKNWKLVVLLLAVSVTVPCLAADLELESQLFTPAPEPKIICDRCLGLYTTAPAPGQASAWGLGSSCSAAQADLTSQLWQQAENNCLNLGHDGACSVTTVVTGACWWSAAYGKYVVDGYANHKCAVTLC